MIGRERALRLLKRVVRESPADQTEALLLTEDSSLTRFTQSTIHQHVAEKNATMILRVVLGKRIAVVTSNRLDASSMRRTLEKAVALAISRDAVAEALGGLPPGKSHCSILAEKAVKAAVFDYQKRS